MRCKKCGWISFDWLETCGKCGKSMEEERLAVGAFIPDRESADWFNMDESVANVQHSSQAKHRLSDIDVSDLVDEAAPPSGEEISIEEVELKRVAEDQDFQKALDQIAG